MVPIPHNVFKQEANNSVETTCNGDRSKVIIRIENKNVNVTLKINKQSNLNCIKGISILAETLVFYQPSTLLIHEKVLKS